MDDQGEKIVFLAREILNEGLPQQTRLKKIVGVDMTFKTLCFTTMLAAAGGAAVDTAVHSESRPLNRYERVELQALLFYTARLKGINEEILRKEIEKESGVTCLDDLTAEDFPSARRYLQEKAL